MGRILASSIRFQINESWLLVAKARIRWQYTKMNWNEMKLKLIKIKKSTGNYFQKNEEYM